MMTTLSLSPEATDITLIESVIETHKIEICKRYAALTQLTKSIGWVVDIPGSGGPELLRLIADLETQVTVLSAIRDHLLSVFVLRRNRNVCNSYLLGR